VNRNGASQNGFLQLSDIYNLKLSAKLVVLSSCSSGLGNDVKGEGLIGLTRGFMYAGSKSVVASLWKVDDRATSELMSRFYRAMLQDNLSPAAALRVAKESLRRERRWRAPYYWAAFVIQGEYREHIVVQRANSRVNYIMLGAPLLLICLISALCAWYRLRKRTASPRSYSAR
jgi:CHAT domain-containing protein